MHYNVKRITFHVLLILIVFSQWKSGGVDAETVTFMLKEKFQQVSIKKNEYFEVSCLANDGVVSIKSETQSTTAKSTTVSLAATGDFCRWEKDGQLQETDVLKIGNSCTLPGRVADVDEHDGNWTCTVLSDGSPLSTVLDTKVIQITVLSRPIGPSIIMDGKEKKHGSYVPVSQTSLIMCRAIYGNPAANLSFQLDGVDVAGHTEVIEYDSTKEKSTDFYLTQHFDTSWYGKTLKCISKHPAYASDPAEAYVHLQRNVSSPTKAFLKEPEDVSVNEGDSVTFVCITEKPFTNCLWEKDGWTIPNSWNYHYVVNSSRFCSIEIKKANNYIKDEMWRCLVGNSTAVEISREAKLTVFVKPLGPMLSVDGMLQMNGTEVQMDVHRHPRVQCHSGSGKPAADLSMSLDGRPLNITHEVSKRGFIFASQMTTESTIDERIDSTWFNRTLVCNASHPSFGNVSRMVFITIREDQRMGGVLFEKEPKDLLLSEDERNVTLDCVTEEPVDSCYWELDGERIPSSMLFKYNNTSQDCSATLYRISFYMNAGYYKCVFIKDLDSYESKMAKISVIVRPNVPLLKLKTRQLKNNTDVVLQIGKVELTCESSFGYPAASLEWKLDGETVEGRYELHKYHWSKKETAYLLLAATVTDDWHGKTLQCIATHELFETDTHKIATSIKIRSPIANVKACFDNGMLEFDSGLDSAPATMYCLTSHDSPLERFRWERRNNQSDVWKPFGDSQNVTVIGESGEFSCVVTNKFEAVRSRSILTISNAPSYVKVSTNLDGTGTIDVHPNQTVKLNCESEAYPAPEYRWERRNSFGISDDDHDAHWMNFSSLQRTQLRGIMGQFVCVAYNRLGSARSKTIVILIPHPVSVVRIFSGNGKTTTTPMSSSEVSDGQPRNITLHCLADGSPPPKYKWVTRQVDDEPWKPLQESQNLTIQQGTIGQFACIAWNDIGLAQQKFSEILKIAPQSDIEAENGLHWILIIVAITVFLIVTVAIITMYARRRKDSWNVVASVRIAFGGDIVSERIRMNDEDDDDDESVAFETSSLSPLN